MRNNEQERTADTTEEEDDPVRETIGGNFYSLIVRRITYLRDDEEKQE